EKGYLKSDVVKGEKFADKAIYSITDAGKAYFMRLMKSYVSEPVPLQFDFNVVVANLNKVSKSEACELISVLKDTIESAVERNEKYATEFADIPLVGRTIIEQQKLLLTTLSEWLEEFGRRFERE
ncbi:MAG: PadR family transcriptional regulator, partial [Christensenellales bacterium]